MPAGAVSITGKGTAIEFRGLPELSRALARDGIAWRRVQKAAVDSTVQNCEHLLNRAVRLAPIREGTLRASGYATVIAGGKPVASFGSKAFEAGSGRGIGKRTLPQAAAEGVEVDFAVVARSGDPTGRGDWIVGKVGFGVPYAQRQHEETEWRHPKGGQALYLSEPLEAHGNAYLHNLERNLRRSFR